LEPGRARAPAEPQTLDDVDLTAPAVSLLERIKMAAHRRHVPYQSLIKTWLAEKLDATDRAGP
jgi:predicted DNA binding CopG/RHH family protein